MFTHILFDLDGTLTDPGLGITNSVIYTLKKYGLEVPERSALYKYIGPPLADCFKMFCSFSDEEAQKAVSVYREYFREKGLFENEVYPGVTDMLEKLKTKGYRLLIATSKPEEFTLRILEHFDMLKYFDFVAGATMDGSRSKKADVIAHALKNGGVTDISSAIMVGDREHDIIGANANGLSSIGVLYGYGSRKELEEAGADYIAETVEDIVSFF